jgi:hypothetical protein
VAGFLAGGPAGAAGSTVLSLDAVATHLLDRVQRREDLDRRPPLRAPRTVLRWAVDVDERWSSAGRVVFTVESDTLRTVDMALGPQDAHAARLLCEDLALHDWLLTTVTAVVEDVISSPRSAPAKAARLRPVVEHLLHLWMPGARVPACLAPVWESIERRPGFTRQWTSSVEWIRDQLAAGAVALLGHDDNRAGAGQSLSKT